MMRGWLESGDLLMPRSDHRPMHINYNLCSQTMCAQSYQFDGEMKSFTGRRGKSITEQRLDLMSAHRRRRKKIHNNKLGKYLIFHVTDYFPFHLTKIHSTLVIQKFSLCSTRQQSAATVK